jgi:cytochrome c553
MRPMAQGLSDAELGAVAAYLAPPAAGVRANGVTPAIPLPPPPARRRARWTPLEASP